MAKGERSTLIRKHLQGINKAVCCMYSLFPVNMQ